MTNRVVRWWQDCGALVVELVTHGAFRCTRCGALQLSSDVGRHSDWHRARGDWF